MTTGRNSFWRLRMLEELQRQRQLQRQYPAAGAEEEEVLRHRLLPALAVIEAQTVPGTGTGTAILALVERKRRSLARVRTRRRVRVRVSRSMPIPIAAQVAAGMARTAMILV
jgi:hypothetical protein